MTLQERKEENQEGIVRKPTPEERNLLMRAIAGAQAAGSNVQEEKKEKENKEKAELPGEVPDPITRTMLIGELLALYPDSAYALMQCGMGCVSCGAAQLESIEEASMVHGLDPDEIVDFLNYKLGIIPLDSE